MPILHSLAGRLFPMLLRHSAHCQEHLRISALASSIFPMALRCSAPASNKPHPAEKSTPVWLAIWRTLAGFANSQLRRAAFRITYLHICAHPHYCHPGPLLRHSKSFGPSAPIAYATSVSPPNEAAAWPRCRYLMGDKAVAWPGADFPMPILVFPSTKSGFLCAVAL